MNDTSPSGNPEMIPPGHAWYLRSYRQMRCTSELLHVSTPMAALIVMLWVGPEGMFPAEMTLSTLISWPWILLWMLAAIVIGYDVRLERLKRRWRRTSTLRVETLTQAFGFAQTALTVTASSPQVGRRGRASSPASERLLWHEAAVLPLTALVYTAAKRGGQDAWPWLTHTVEMLSTGDHDAAWRRSAVAVSLVDDELSRWVSRVWEMDARQRASVAAAMRQAILPYAGVVDR